MAIIKKQIKASLVEYRSQEIIKKTQLHLLFNLI